MRRSHHSHGQICRSRTLLGCLLSVCILVAVHMSAVIDASSTAFIRTSIRHHPTSTTTILSSESTRRLTQLRGGEIVDDDSSSAAPTEIEFESSDEGEDEDDDDEEEEVTADASLAKSVKAATAKVQSKAQDVAISAAKSSLKSALQAKKATKKASSSSSSMSFFAVPYIIKATLNPVTFIQMTKAYWSSLLNHNYLKENTDASDELRNSIDRNRGSSGGGKKGKRKFKPGQAKTLSDLPALPT